MSYTYENEEITSIKINSINELWNELREIIFLQAKEIDQIKSNNEELDWEKRDLKLEIDELGDKIEELEYANQNLESEKSELEDKLEELKKEYLSLKK